MPKSGNRAAGARGRATSSRVEMRIAATNPKPVDALGAGRTFKLTTTASALVVEFASRLQQRLDSEGADALDDLDVAQVADRLAASVPSGLSSEWDELIGPFYDTAALVAWKRMTRQRLSMLRRQDRLLSVRTKDGVTLHPAFQFDVDGGLLPGLERVAPLLRPVVADDWSLALWFNTAIDEWQDRTPAQLLRGSATDQDRVLALAEEDAARLRASGVDANATTA